MNKLSCKDCLHFFNSRVCLCRHVELPIDCDICPFFADKDGKRPRFCRLASSVDEMAKALVLCHRITANWECYCVSTTEKCFDDYEYAIASAKKWLMEVE